MTELFLAYGSTLDPATWPDGRIPMHPVGPASLPDNVLAFDYWSRGRGCGVLNLRKRIGGIASGYLFTLDDASLASLDRREGHPNCYAREEVVVLDREGHEVRAVTYRVVPGRVVGFIRPNAEYLTSCMVGRERFDLPVDDLEAASHDRESVCDAVFTYGTLMRGELRSSSWKDFHPSCALLARAFGTLHDHGAYPGFVPGTGDLVEGDFMRFGRIGDALERFDDIEGFTRFGSSRNLFRRALVEVDVGGGRARRAWTYTTTRPEAPRILDGNWRKAKGTHRSAMSSILAAHAASGSAFIDRLANVPDGPFGTVCREGTTYSQVLQRLEAGGYDERGLCRASGNWRAWT